MHKQKSPISSFTFCTLVTLSAAAFFSSPRAVAGSNLPPAPPKTEESGPNFYTGEGVSLGGVLFPHVHLHGVVGGSTAEEIESLASGHHDPQTDLTLQSAELGLSLRLGDYVQGFTVFSAYSDADQEIDGEFEEAFLKLVNIPGGFELRGGRFYNRFGFQNAVHNHGWDFVNQNLPNGRMLMEGHFSVDGGELTWNVPAPFRSALSFAIGEAVTHDHEHHHEEHGDEAAVDSHLAGFDDLVFNVNYSASLDYNDFYQNRFVLSGAFGENGFGRDTWLAALGYEFLWREKGYEPGGRCFRWRTELVYRDVEAVSGMHHHHEHAGHEHAHDDHHEHEHADHEHEHADHEHHARNLSFDDFGLTSSIAYGFSDRVEAGLRFDWIEGVSGAELPERWRISPNLTVGLNPQKTLYARVQYDFDQMQGGDDEHSVWLQVGFNWGGPEVR